MEIWTKNADFFVNSFLPLLVGNHPVWLTSCAHRLPFCIFFFPSYKSITMAFSSMQPSSCLRFTLMQNLATGVFANVSRRQEQQCLPTEFSIHNRNMGNTLRKLAFIGGVSKACYYFHYYWGASHHKISYDYCNKHPGTTASPLANWLDWLENHAYCMVNAKKMYFSYVHPFFQK